MHGRIQTRENSTSVLSEQPQCSNKKQCSRQLQYEVPCRSVISSILPCPPCLLRGGSGRGEGVWWGEGVGGRGGVGGGVGEGAGDISSTLPYTALPHGASPKGTSHNHQVVYAWTLAFPATEVKHLLVPIFLFGLAVIRVDSTPLHNRHVRLQVHHSCFGHTVPGRKKVKEWNNK